MTASISLRLDFEAGRIGPGKIELLERIAAHGSIAAAGRSLGMSYRRAWMLVDEMNRIFGRALVETAQGGRAGGGARLSALGTRVATHYRAAEAAALAASGAHLDALLAELGAPGECDRPV